MRAGVSTSHRKALADHSASGHLTSVTAISGMERSISNPLKRLGARIFSSRYAPAMLRNERIGRSMMTPWFGHDPTNADLDQVRRLSSLCSGATRGRVARATSHIDLRPSFAAGGPRTLILCGRNDSATPLRHSERIAAAIDASSLAIIDDAGHMIIAEKPVETTKLIVDWIGPRAGGARSS